MFYYAKIKPILLNSKNGAVISDGASISYSTSSNIANSIELTVGEYTEIILEKDTTSISISAEPTDQYNLKAINSEIYERFRDKYVIFAAKNSLTSPLPAVNLADIVDSAITSDGAIEILVYVYLDSKTKVLTYNANGGTGAPESQSFIAGSSITLSSTAPTRTGYTFYGWNLAGTTTIYNPRQTISEGFLDDTTLYAMWSETDYTEDKYLNSLVYKV